MKDYIQLNENDNVVITLKNLEEGTIIEVNGQSIELKALIKFGHKIAIKSIEVNEKVLKYGFSIGNATQKILAGEHVHTQNLETDYQK